MTDPNDDGRHENPLHPDVQDALRRSHENPLLPEQLAGLVAHPTGAAEDARAVSHRFADRAGPEVMGTVAASWADVLGGGDGTGPLTEDGNPIVDEHE